MPEKQNLPSWARLDEKTGLFKKLGPMGNIVGIAVVVVVTLAIGIGFTMMNKARPAGGPGGGGPGGGGGFGGGFGGGGRRPAITVGTAKAALGQIPITLDALGTVTPPVTATITSRIAGNLMSVNYKEGQMVRKGQVLAQIDPRPYRVALEQAQGTLARDQAQVANAQVDLKRYQTLLSQNSIASQQVDTQAALVKQDEGIVLTDQAAVDAAKLNLDYTTITSPVAGRVGLRQVDVGNYVTAGSAAGLVVITVVDPIDVVFSVPEDNIPKIMARQRRGATLPAIALNRDGGAQLSQGTLSTLDTQIDTSTGTVKAKAHFDNGSGALFPQQFVNIHLLVDTLCNVVVVPTTSVRHGSQGDYVFVVQPDKTAKVVYVKTGPGTAETVSIASGVSAGDVVITDGGDRLRDGSPVQLPGDKPLAAGQGAQSGQGGQGPARRAGGQGRGGGQGGAGAGAGAGGGAARLANLPPDVRAKIAAMTPDQRRAFFQQRGGGGGGGRRNFNGPGGAPPPPAQAGPANPDQAFSQGASCDAQGGGGGQGGQGGQGGRGQRGQGGQASLAQGQGGQGQGGQGGQGRGGGQGFGANLTPEQRARFQAMTPEQRAAFRAQRGGGQGRNPQPPAGQAGGEPFFDPHRD